MARPTFPSFHPILLSIRCPKPDLSLAHAEFRVSTVFTMTILRSLKWNVGRW